MIRKLLIFSLLVLLSATINAQNFWEDYKANGIDVDGVKIGQVMNYGQFVAKFGKPDKYLKNDIGDGDEPCWGEYYRIENNTFYFRGNAGFNDFVLCDNKFAALTSWIPGGIRVGDKLSKLDNFKYGKPIVASWLKPENGFVKYVLFYNYLDDLVFFAVKDGIICRIIYSGSI